MKTFIQAAEIWVLSKDRTQLEFGGGLYGPLEELRAGIHARGTSSADAPSQPLTLEQIFLDIVGEDRESSDPTRPEQELSWLG